MAKELPKHIAFVPDGNRRWAKKTGRSIYDAYDVGIRHIKDVLEWVKEKGIKKATFWGFSTENFKRSDEEKNTIWELFDKVLLSILDEYKKNPSSEVRVRFIGKLSLLPSNLVEKMEELMRATEGNGPYELNVLLAYGGRAELIDAVNMLIKSGARSVTEEEFQKYLYLNDDVDFVIRTGGVVRTSGYLPWQAAYAEWYFSEKLWPEFSKEDFEKALGDYLSRDRRFGR